MRMIAPANVSLSAELEEAYTESRASLVRFLSRRLDNRYQAEDLAQDIYVALRHFDGRDNIGSPRGLLFRVARNLAINLNSQEARRAALRKSQADILWTAVDEVTPERHLLDREALEAIGAALADLPERTRQILVWRRLDGLRNVEIARRLGVSTTAVEKHLRTAMTHLAGALDAQAPRF